jgi:hypothetical protein
LLLKRLVQCRPERRHRRILDASAPLLADLAELARPKKGHEGQRAAILARRATYQDSEAMLANLDGWCDTWRDNLDAADYALRRKTRAALGRDGAFLPRRARAALPGADRLDGGREHQYEIWFAVAPDPTAHALHGGRRAGLRRLGAADRLRPGRNE